MRELMCQGKRVAWWAHLDHGRCLIVREVDAHQFERRHELFLVNLTAVIRVDVFEHIMNFSLQFWREENLVALGRDIFR